MKAPSLQKTAALSAGLHLTLFLLSALILRQSAHTSLPSPYIVSLIGPASESRDTGDSRTSEALHPDTKAVPAEKSTAPDTKSDQRIKDEIEAIAAKKRLEELAKLKHDMLQIRGRGEQVVQKSVSQAKAVGTARGVPGAGSYTDKIISEIWKEWVFADTNDKNLETVIEIKISKDGTITPLRVEKKSGNLLFDRSALNALRKASPVTPPPEEMVIGIRFYP